MRLLFITIAALAASPATAQVSNPAPPIDTSQFASKVDVEAAQAAASNAASLASSADTKATSAQTAAASTVKTVNGLTPTNGNVSIAIPTMPDMSAYTTTSTVNSMISSATTGVVKSVNATTPNASGAVTLAIPTASTTTPPCIADTGTAGTTSTTLFAPFNHTHCSKTRRIRATSAADGSYVWTYTVPFTAGTTPICSVTAETVSGITDVINAQIEGTPTATAMNVRITRANRSVASLIGLTVLSIPSQPGATPFHAICIEP